MTPQKLVRVRNSAVAAFKRFLSYRKHDWALSDYPYFIRRQLNVANASEERSIPVFLAYMVGWNLTGTGDTARQAKSNLLAIFNTAKENRLAEGKEIPRPGTTVLAEFASDENIERNRMLSKDFIDRVLEMQWAFISDESSLWDFHSEMSNDFLQQKIQDVYGVDVSDIESGRLWQILDRIAAHLETVHRTQTD
jgi:hypothetical protein